MITILEVIKLSAEYLDKKGVESPRVNAEILLTEVLKSKRIDLYLSFDKPLGESELTAYREMIRKRGMRIPLQYILGYVEFYGIKLKVDSSVLIPRPETELLVENIILDVKNNGEIKILDIGVGSGNISIALLMNLPGASVIGIDTSPTALETARLNSITHSVQNRIELSQFNILSDNIETLGKFDIVVSNPPYISKSDYNTLEPELKNYEPFEALTDDSDGFTFYDAIISKSKNLYKTSGKLYLEIAQGQANIIKSKLIENNFSDIRIIKDLAGIDRIICGEIE
jgi:release factor glutamine methyltransferase